MSELGYKAAGVRVLLLPNEGVLGDQIGVRQTFAELNAEGVIGKLDHFSFLPDLKKDADIRRSHRDLLALAQRFQPDIIFWQHPHGYPLDRSYLASLRAAAGDPMIAYHEADPFDTYFKRLKKSEIALYQESDVFLTSALGLQRELFQRQRVHPEFHYLPSAVDRERFATMPIVERENVSLDAIMIGSIAYRLRIIKHPGSAERVKLARELSRCLGTRFATYGRRWPAGTRFCGSLPYDQQEQMLRGAKVAVMWEHFPHNSFYFSDRLPIAMGSGTPFIASKRPGYETFFAGAPGLYFVDTVREAADTVLYMRSLPERSLCEIGLAARDWMLKHLEARPVFRQAFSLCLAAWRRRAFVGNIAR